jgi:hypothetical protein
MSTCRSRTRTRTRRKKRCTMDHDPLSKADLTDLIYQVSFFPLGVVWWLGGGRRRRGLIAAAPSAIHCNVCAACTIIPFMYYTRTCVVLTTTHWTRPCKI